MNKKPQLTQSRLKELLFYEQETGVFSWLVTRCSRTPKSSVAGWLDKFGYCRIMVDKKRYAAHRLAWLYMTGNFPEHEIDHINGIREDNRWCNLREATRKQNMENTKLQANNTSGFRGVTYFKPRNKWAAKVVHRGQEIRLGYFSTPQQAGEAARIKRQELFTHDIGRDQ